jgi:CDP-4-dehydro-6-deoxyglucose reductase, E1
MRTDASAKPKAYALAADTFGPEEIEAAKRVLDSGRLTMGEQVKAFEREFAAWTGAKQAVMVNSGSSANLIAVDALLRRCGTDAPLKAGDEVLIPGLAWPTTAWPVAQLGLVPVFVDIDPTTLAIDLASAKAALTPRTRGMFLIHVLGRVPDMAAYKKFCDDNGVTLVEDTCESLGAHYDGRHAGTFGAMGTFSFYFSHHISSIEGGAVVTNDDELADDLRSLRAHGWVRDRTDKQAWKDKYPEFDDRFLFITGGYNVRPMELQAAIGRVQLGRLDDMLDGRQELAGKVAAWTKSVPWLKLLGAECLAAGKATRRARTHSWMTFPLVVDASAPVDVDQVKQKLEDTGVETRPIIAGNLARHPAVQRFTSRTAGPLSQCDRLLERGFMIGCHPVLAPGALEALEAGFAALGKL